MNFCRLPPDRLRAAAVDAAAATLKSRDDALRRSARARAERMSPQRDECRRVAVSSAFSASDHLRHGAAAESLLGHEGEPERAPRRPVRAGRRARPARRDRPPAPARAARPTSAGSSSFWPLPATPAMPRISPSRDGEAGCRSRSVPNGSAEARRSPLTTSALGAGRVRQRTRGGDDLAADHHARERAPWSRRAGRIRR